MRNQSDRENGMTLIEIMVVVIILGILATMVFTRVTGRTEQARRIKAVVEIRAMQNALELFRVDNGFYPSTEQGIDALIAMPSTGQVALNYNEEGYLDKVPFDPWGSPYLYISPGARGPYDLWSYGPDGEEGGEGRFADIMSWDLE